ncbi:putative F-box domain, FBD domain, leucine-rich repeat domain, L domain-containing protein [Medicago truncatula]|uniref:F-box/RNI/FBD-like domain protein n=1 Tax=Medicago truncatula TaxID=3880 RepID=G7IJX3_MEDTR|nr:FBD-associated F-box protein At4g10400 [Medicago truncatula]AES63311.1 F-box/RNI/FBD-like domain protein [Medicago truncatula]RHN71551.1 putative F-box domain, FBD domain, leucine-rich repeat domain, L domain-containing protein [Medicago truncatula]
MSKQECSTAAVDRIGSLPDDTLIHVLSFVPTKKAVATSILSKRWIHLWCYAPVLNFTERKLEGQESVLCFHKFVCSVLHSREAAGNYSINTFILHIEYFFADAPIPKLPISDLTTLVVLKLHRVSSKTFDSISNFPSLKTLHLKDIYFDQLSNVQFFRWMLVDGCPVLEDLQLSNINFFICYTHHSFDDFENSSMLRKLNRADITDCECYFPVKSLSNLEFLHIQLYEVYHPYDFPTFNNLTWLLLNYDWDIVVQVLHHCPKLQNLELYQVRDDDDWVYESELIKKYYQEKENWANPEFVPSCLTSNLTTCTMWDFAYAGQQRNHIMLARFILENARVLETMSMWCYTKGSKVELERVLSSCHRASSACQLSMYCL